MYTIDFSLSVITALANDVHIIATCMYEAASCGTMVHYLLAVMSQLSLGKKLHLGLGRVVKLMPSRDLHSGTSCHYNC